VTSIEAPGCEIGHPRDRKKHAGVAAGWVGVTAAGTVAAAVGESRVAVVHCPVGHIVAPSVRVSSGVRDAGVVAVGWAKAHAPRRREEAQSEARVLLGTG